LAHHRGDDPPADHEAADVGALRLLDELLDEEVGVESTKASITDSAALSVSHSTMPRPCVPSVSFTTTGALPTMPRRSLVSSGECAKPGHRHADALARQQLVPRSLSRERVIATDSLSE